LSGAHNAIFIQQIRNLSSYDGLSSTSSTTDALDKGIGGMDPKPHEEKKRKIVCPR
jgi:hypothetical protein